MSGDTILQELERWYLKFTRNLYKLEIDSSVSNSRCDMDKTGGSVSARTER